MNQPIELRRLRDFGQTINDTFTFLKENFKQLFIPILTICGFFVVLGSITTVFSLTNAGYVYASDNYVEHSRAVIYLISIIADLLVLLMAHLCIFLIVFCYVAIYVQKNNTPASLAEVWGYFKYYFFRAFGSGLLISIMVVVGFMFCFIPGIYLTPIFYLILPIMVIENASFSYAFNKSFKLIKDNWWQVFGVIFIMWVLVAVSGLFVNISISFIKTGTRFISLKQFTFPVIVFFSIMKSLLVFVYILPAIACALCYFNLIEEKEAPGLLHRIEQFGKADNDQPTLPSEDY